MPHLVAYGDESTRSDLTDSDAWTIPVESYCEASAGSLDRAVLRLTPENFRKPQKAQALRRRSNMRLHTPKCCSNRLRVRQTATRARQVCRIDRSVSAHAVVRSCSGAICRHSCAARELVVE
jgi:hypothetical protein